MNGVIVPIFARGDTSWYPRARLSRQPAVGNWGSVMQAVRTALADDAFARTGVD